METKIIQVEIKQVDGVTVFVPHNQLAKDTAKLFSSSTISLHHLSSLKKMGFVVQGLTALTLALSN